MTTIHARSSRLSPLDWRTVRRRAATTLLCAAGCVAAVSCNGVEPTATPASVRSPAAAHKVAWSSARGGVSQMSVMYADG